MFIFYNKVAICYKLAIFALYCGKIYFFIFVLYMVWCISSYISLWVAVPRQPKVLKGIGSLSVGFTVKYPAIMKSCPKSEFS